MNKISFEIKQKVLKRDNFTCQKCGFQDLTGEELEIHRIDPKDDSIGNLVVLCSICSNYAPDNKKKFLRYIKEKIDGSLLDTFRKASKTKQGMLKQFLKGNLVTKPPLGYKIINKKLFPAENSYIIQEIYKTFLNNKVSLTQLAKKYNLSVNGLKKILTNQTYLGKVKFAGKIVQGKHAALISEDLFQKVQEKLKIQKHP